MAASEIRAFNTGADVARVESDPIDTPETWAWRTGIARAILGRGITAFLLLSQPDLTLMLTAEAANARVVLGHDTWAYWVRRGYEDAKAKP